MISPWRAGRLINSSLSVVVPPVVTVPVSYMLPPAAVASEAAKAPLNAALFLTNDHATAVALDVLSPMGE